MADTLDRTSVVPLYHQLKDMLRDKVESGELIPGDPVPSEPEWAQSLGISRATARRALGDPCGPPERACGGDVRANRRPREQPYGKRPEERDLILRHLAEVEPLLRATATMEIDGSAPLDEVVRQLERLE